MLFPALCFILFDASFFRAAVLLLRASGRRRYGRWRADVVVLNLVTVERQIALENYVERGTAREFGLRSARQQSCGKSGETSDTRTDAGTLDASRDRADACSCRSRGGNRFCVLPFSAATGGFALVIHRFGSAGVGAARVGVEIDGVAVRENQSIELHPEFAAAFYPARAFGFSEFAAEIGADWNDDFVVLGDRERSAQVDGVAGLGAAGGDAIFENDGEARSCGDEDARSGRNGRSGGQLVAAAVRSEVESFGGRRELVRAREVMSDRELRLRR